MCISTESPNTVKSRILFWPSRRWRLVNAVTSDTCDRGKRSISSCNDSITAINMAQQSIVDQYIKQFLIGSIDNKTHLISFLDDDKVLRFYDHVDSHCPNARRLVHLTQLHETLLGSHHSFKRQKYQAMRNFPSTGFFVQYCMFSGQRELPCRDAIVNVAR